MSFNEVIIVNSPVLHKVNNVGGLEFSFFENGCLKSIIKDSVQLNLLSGSLLDAGCANIYLRKRDDQLTAIPLFGPKSPARQTICDGIVASEGKFEDISYSCRLLLAEQDSSWLWEIRVENIGDVRAEVDLIYVQDIGLVAADGSEKNESYVSQYIDYTVFEHPSLGKVVCCRQNEHGPDCIPWLALGSISKAGSFSTDGLQFFGIDFKGNGVAKSLSLSELDGLSQQELAVVALQEQPFFLEPSSSRQAGFFGVFCGNHTEPSSLKDMDFVDEKVDSLRQASLQPWSNDYNEAMTTKSLFTESPFLASEDLTEAELDNLFDVDRRHCEFAGDELLSFFYGENRHVVMRRKELLVDRPHGHISRTGDSFIPEEQCMSFTSHMFGVFLSHVTQGNVNFNRLISPNTNPINLERFTGQRIFIKLDGGYYQLGVPSAFEMTLNGCRWIYKNDDQLLQVEAWASTKKHEVSLKLDVLKGDPVEWLISNQLTSEPGWDFNGISASGGKASVELIPNSDSQLACMYPDASFSMLMDDSDCVRSVGSDEFLFADKQNRGLNFIVFDISATKKFKLTIVGNLAFDEDTEDSLVLDHELCDDVLSEGACLWADISSSLNIRMDSDNKPDGLDEIFEMLPWFAQNAQIHYLTPHGLEQYSGAAWGTRDISQGPLEMLMSLGLYNQARTILTKVFSNQNEDGNWPQWWMFDRYQHIRSGESHGDVIFWPILALSEYVKRSNDLSILDEILPYYNNDDSSSSGKATLADHILRAIRHIKEFRLVKGTCLPNYSDGDWNDSMQPANTDLKDNLISSWTVGLSYQTFKSFADLCHKSGRDEMAKELEVICDDIQRDFNRYLIREGIVSGFGLVKEDTVKLLLHPSDSATGINYRLLPMIRGIISGIFTAEQAKAHCVLIEKYLKGSDGARLMDKPPHYQGGKQEYFKRAETCPSFGREIGVMYTHAHLRYAEAMARMGDAKRFIKAMRQVVPINIKSVIPQADLRQSNCYYSSSDADVVSRYQVNDSYDDVVSGKVALKGGWRIYSSGPGMVVRFVIEYLLGIRHSYGKIIFDPVLIKEYNGLTVSMELGGRLVKIIYSVSDTGCGVNKVEINGSQVDFDIEVNPYRSGGAIIGNDTLASYLGEKNNVIKISI